MYNKREDEDKISVLTNKVHNLDKRVTHIEIINQNKHKNAERDLETINGEISNLKKSKATIMDKIGELAISINKYGWQIGLLWIAAGFIIVSIMSKVLQ